MKKARNAPARPAPHPAAKHSTGGQTSAGRPPHSPTRGRAGSSFNLTHSRIIEATIDSIVARGLSGTTVQTIADEAAVSTATVIKHFKTKDGVLDAVVEMLAAEFEAARRQVTEETGGDPVKCFDRLIEISFHPELSSDRRISAWYAYSGEVTSRAIYERHMRKVDQSLARQVLEMCRKLAVAGNYRSIDPEAVAFGFIGAMEWLWLERLLGRRKVHWNWARKVLQAYLAGVFPRHFAMPAGRGHDGNGVG
ncbi:TetR family transcriptional regulator [Dongia mobilis]|uniref:TetR family transcriptional regulator n=1 Tax=Dongia mobilis TaxID=578943 RepID=A0A4R6WYW9_9PROT|nr:TetR/AcrR family transcriptional regulator [Dongia mobilis]TDQ82997.1 TetR family transcriptional regulator [Dongia mobilis]